MKVTKKQLEKELAGKSPEEIKTMALDTLRKRYHEATDTIIERFATASPCAALIVARELDLALKAACLNISVQQAYGPHFQASQVITFNAEEKMAATAGMLEESSRYLQEPLAAIGRAIDAAIARVIEMLPEGRKYIPTRSYVQVIDGSAQIAASLTDMHKAATAPGAPSIN